VKAAASTIAIVAIACQGGRTATRPTDDARSVRAASDADVVAVVVAECPVPRGTGVSVASEVDRLLDAAHKAFEAGRPEEAWTCADRAADLEPAAVEAHHLRAASLAALGRHADAELAYLVALAIDPDDVETLRAVAEYEVSTRPDRPRDALLFGRALARRGREALRGRGRPDPAIAADLYVIEARAENDLGRADLALELADAALAAVPTLTDATYERAMALFNLARFAEAEVGFRAVLEATPDDAYARHHLGLALEWLDRGAEAEIELAKARELAPDKFGPAVTLPEAEVRAVIDETIGGLSPALAAQVRAIPVLVVDRPELADLRSVDPPFPPTILGLFRGLPAGQNSVDAPARAILLYRVNLSRAARTVDELREQIRETLLHEIGHLEGADEDDLRRRGLE
jgi:Flp pilus assembly protein TadD/predicted Zn-dependent protease with MMP-like domain